VEQFDRARVASANGGYHARSGFRTTRRDIRAGHQAGQHVRAASDALSKAGELTGQAAGHARQAAADAASTVTTQVKDMLDRQVGVGASMIGQVADTAKRAAADLDGSAPQLAGLVRGMADQMSGYAENLREQSAEELVRRPRTSPGDSLRWCSDWRRWPASSCSGP